MKQFSPWWLFFCLVLLPIHSIAVTNIIGVHIQDKAGYSTLVFDLDGSSEIKLFPLESPYRVVVDLPGAHLGNPRQLNTIKSTRVRGIRTAFQSDGRLRIVLDTTRPLWPRHYFSGDDKKTRLVIELRDAAGVPIPPAKIQAKVTPVATPNRPHSPILTPAVGKRLGNTNLVPEALAPTHPTPPEVAVVVDKTFSPQPAKTAPVPAVTPESDSTESWNEQQVLIKPVVKGRDIIIAVDAGHGGKDPGATGPGGTEEKDVTLSIARRVAELLRKERGMRPILTRNGDYFVALRERIQKARAAKADLFISIHADAAYDPAVAGASVYVLSEKGASSEAARFLAEKENSVDLVGGLHLEGRDNNLARTLLDMSQSATLDASLTVASRLLTYMEKISILSRSSVERAGFLVLKSPDIPSVLVETAYLSNPDEEEKLGDARYQQTLSQAIMKGIRSHFLRNPPSGTLLAQSMESVKLVQR